MDLFDVARDTTDEVLGEGTYDTINKGNPNPGVQRAIARGAKPFQYEAVAQGPDGSREFLFDLAGFDATAIVETEARKHLREGETLISVLRRVEPEQEL